MPRRYNDVHGLVQVDMAGVVPGKHDQLATGASGVAALRRQHPAALFITLAESACRGHAQLTVEYDGLRIAATPFAHGEPRIIGNNRTNPDQDAVVQTAQLVGHLQAAFATEGQSLAGAVVMLPSKLWA